MNKKRFPIIIRLSALLLIAYQPHHASAENANGVWTDPDTARREDPDFLIQGEYGTVKPGAAWGAQVVALGGGNFDACLLKDGLPGLGWTRDKSRILLKGKRVGDKVMLESDDKSRLAEIRDGEFVITGGDGKGESLPRIERRSPTLGAPPPKGAMILFDGGGAEKWENGKVENRLLIANGSTTRDTFRDYRLHLEFLTPYKPAARGQDRGNSGIYHSGRWETQVLDSFALTGEDNECGGIYSVAKPLLNMCLPPLSWQTYDVKFTAARFDADGKRIAWPRITVLLNGVLVHDDLELPKDFTTAAPSSMPLTAPEGPVHIQYHGNPVMFRNIWIVPGK